MGFDTLVVALEGGYLLPLQPTTVAFEHGTWELGECDKLRSRATLLSVEYLLIYLSVFGSASRANLASLSPVLAAWVHGEIRYIE
jgi:hypothetical protein